MTLSPDLNRPCRRQSAKRVSSIRCTVFSASEFMAHIQIAEPRVGAVPAKADNACLTVAVFGDNALGLILVGLAVLPILGVIVGRTVEEQHDIKYCSASIVRSAPAQPRNAASALRKSDQICTNA